MEERKEEGQINRKERWFREMQRRGRTGRQRKWERGVRKGEVE